MSKEEIIFFIWLVLGIIFTSDHTSNMTQFRQIKLCYLMRFVQNLVQKYSKHMFIFQLQISHLPSNAGHVEDPEKVLEVNSQMCHMYPYLIQYF